MRLHIKCSKEVRGVFAEEYVTIDAGEYDVTDLEAIFGRTEEAINTLHSELYLFSARSELGRSALVSVEAFEALKANNLIIVF